MASAAPEDHNVGGPPTWCCDECISTEGLVVFHGRLECQFLKFHWRYPLKRLHRRCFFLPSISTRHPSLRVSWIRAPFVSWCGCFKATRKAQAAGDIASGSSRKVTSYLMALRTSQWLNASSLSVCDGCASIFGATHRRCTNTSGCFPRHALSIFRIHIQVRAFPGAPAQLTFPLSSVICEFWLGIVLRVWVQQAPTPGSNGQQPGCCHTERPLDAWDCSGAGSPTEGRWLAAARDDVLKGSIIQ